MMRPPCHELDDCLSGCLSRDQRQAFESHLAGCPACREEVHAQRAIDQLLQQATACETPLLLIARMERSVHHVARRRLLRRAAVCSMAAAALLAFVWRWSHQPIDVVQQPGFPAAIDSVSPASPEALHEPPAVRVVIDPRSELLAVPQKSSQPNVTIYWLYPTLQAAAPANQAAEGEPTPRSET